MKAPRGFYAVWGSIAAGAGAVIALSVLHHPARVLPPLASGPAPRVSAPAVARPGPARSVPVLAPEPHVAAVAPSRSAPVPSVTPGTPPASPAPSPSRGPVGVSATVVTPLRGSTPVSASVSLVVPAGPPFPTLDLAIALP